MLEVSITFSNREHNRGSWFICFWEIHPKVGIIFRIIGINNIPGNDFVVLSQDVKGEGITTVLSETLESSWKLMGVWE